MARIWNGEHTDYRINLSDRPQVLKVTMAHYRWAKNDIRENEDEVDFYGAAARQCDDDG
jgi:hypothetical protein